MFWLYWLVIAIVLIVIEAMTINIVSIWFVISSLIAMIVSLFTDNLVIQIGVFVIVGVILLFLTKPIIDKYLKQKNIKTNLDRVIGMTGIVTEEIKKNSIGEIKVDGKRWSAISNMKILVGENVKVLKIDGVKLIVEKENDL